MNYNFLEVMNSIVFNKGMIKREESNLCNNHTIKWLVHQYLWELVRVSMDVGIACA